MVKGKKGFKDLSDDEKLLENIKDLFSMNFAYSEVIAIDYNSAYNCDDGCDPYCRCGTISQVNFKDLNINKIVEILSDKIQDKIILYCIDRIVRYSNINIGNFNAKVDRGYYGEEVNGVDFSNEYLSSNLYLLCKRTDIERIKHVLELEYGYLLPEIKLCNWVSVKSILSREIDIGQKDHYRKLNKQLIESYNTYTHPRCICLSNEDGYRLIDGYHRLHSNNNLGKDDIDIIVLE
jgi:hypothetical protein